MEAACSNGFLSAALKYAAAGVRVFPCEGKKPLVKWKAEATTDADTLRRWWREWPHAQIGRPTGSGIVVLDVDNKNGADGSGSLHELEKQHGELPEGPIVITPTGGYHYYLRADNLKNSAGKLSPGLDIRADGGYVIAPPSPGYEWECDPAEYPIPDAPRWLVEACRKPEQSEHPEANCKIARNDTLCRMAGAARANGADTETIRAMVQGANEAIPPEHGGPLALAELESTVFKSAAQWEQGEGAGEAKAFTPPEPMPIDLDLDNIPPVDWLFNNMFVKSTVTGLDAAGGSGKTFALITLAASLALGRGLWPSVQPAHAGTALLFLAEEDANIYRRRLRDIAYLHELTPEEIQVIGERVCVYPESAMQIVHSDNQGAVTPTTAYQWLLELAAEKKPDWIVLDPRSKFAGFVENSNEECNAYFELMAKIARASGACITLAHHTSKAAELNTGSSAGRGASAARDAVRAQLNMGPFTERDADGWAGRLGIVNYENFVKLRLSKNNHGPTMSNPQSIVLHRVHEGAMLEYDSKAAAADAEKNLMAGLSRAIAKAVRDSPPVSKHEIMREWNEERYAWREQYQCKNTDIKRAIEHAIEVGLMREVIEATDTAGKPRMVLEVIGNCNDDD
jgi:hypothetical protein